MSDMKAEATTKLGGAKKRGPGFKLVGDFKKFGKDDANKASKKSV